MPHQKSLIGVHRAADLAQDFGFLRRGRGFGCLLERVLLPVVHETDILIAPVVHEQFVTLVLVSLALRGELALEALVGRLDTLHDPLPVVDEGEMNDKVVVVAVDPIIVAEATMKRRRGRQRDRARTGRRRHRVGGAGDTRAVILLVQNFDVAGRSPDPWVQISTAISRMIRWPVARSLLGQIMFVEDEAPAAAASAAKAIGMLLSLVVSPFMSLGVVIP